ncbi:DUF4829 domain-containing protein [uncultured Tissierella sp.]|jgi:hypothetical protein|uniref:DUF4829 domain-containing protein n=1 Tax=uncultured Tissierella sp. TaxID=448160 RepID=UPI0028046B2C|nr:DUF4829 domain-containing protein [uncultured Tissierella sp.]MDU5080203.1 DUF4829 domain-containing protein [Bacillota bacterium]
MRKIIISIFTILLVFSLASYKQNNISDDLMIDIGESAKFTEEEITEAIDLVKNNFDFPASTLTKVWYDEEKSDSYFRDDFKQGVIPENVILLLSNFDVDGSGDNPVLNPNSTYTNYQWILRRGSKTSKWRIEDWGY